MLLCSLPANATDGAAFSGLIEVWADALDKTMRCRFAHSYAGLTGNDMLNTAANAAVFSFGGLNNVMNVTKVIHGDVTSDWRPSLDTVVLPRWFKFAFPLLSGKLVIDESAVSYEGA
jgi:hypothetical protein